MKFEFERPYIICLSQVSQEIYFTLLGLKLQFRMR